MRKFLPLLFAAGATLADAPAPPSTEDALVVHVGTAKFADSTAPNMPKGLKTALIGVDPNTKGTTGYARTPGGSGLAAHWHSFAEYTVLLDGKGTLVVAGKQHEIAPGSYFVIPAKAVHQLTCAAGGDCLLLTRRAGPTDYNFVKP
jgi:mannose-6-phosphate isomerase-like protein (cupin superfamily)